MKQPISFAYRNIVFGESVTDAWAVYRLQMTSYAGLTATAKGAVLARLASFAHGIGADFSLLRVARPWSVENYAIGVQTTTDVRHVRREPLDRYLVRQQRQLQARSAQTPEVYVSVRLPRERPSGVVDDVIRSSLHRIRGGLDRPDPRMLSERRLERLLAGEETTFARALEYLDCERAAADELQWLIRRAFCRSLGDPLIDQRFAPQALVFNAPEAEGGARYRPLEVDVLRLFESPINIEPRSLRIESELGESHQAMLCVGALPGVVRFPGQSAELLFAPLEAVDFPVDACFSARYVQNEDAVRLVRRRVIARQHHWSGRRHGDLGPTASGERPQVARELEQYLRSGTLAPLLLAGISLCVSAPTQTQLEERVERLRDQYGVVKLHRPLGDQLRLFVTHLPAQASRVPDYDDYLTVEQFGAMVPVATHAVGASAGAYIGHTLAGARQPVLFDPTEARRTSRAPATLLAGMLGSGKTLCLELIMYQAFLAGSTVCDIDPKGDHGLERLPGVAEHMEIIELSPEDRFRGMLDPLRIAGPDTREALACNFLLSILPEPIPLEWETEIRLAVHSVAAGGGRSCGEVLAELERGAPAARDAGRALSSRAASGLARLGFAARGSRDPTAGPKQVTSLRIRNLALPLPGVPRAEMVEEERLGYAILHLLAVYGLRLASTDPRRHSVLGCDEAWVLLSDAAGRRLIDRILRVGRAENVTPLLTTQVLGEVDELEGLVGACFCFGVETDAEARKALRLLRLDEDDEALRGRLMSFRRGRCMMRDYEGRVSPIQVDLVDPELLAALDTSSGRAGPDTDPDQDAAGTGAVAEIHELRRLPR